jgi:hypothetical protein
MDNTANILSSTNWRVADALLRRVNNGTAAELDAANTRQPMPKPKVISIDHRQEAIETSLELAPSGRETTYDRLLRELLAYARGKWREQKIMYKKGSICLEGDASISLSRDFFYDNFTLFLPSKTQLLFARIWCPTRETVDSPRPRAFAVFDGGKR